MKHSSVPLPKIELINFKESEYSPLISKCDIKVCYVDEDPNRNGTVIDKKTAKAMAVSLRGSPIVGYYSPKENDYEEHNKMIEVSNGEWKITDTTKPYGFVDINAKVWFQKFLDDDKIEREYLVTQGFLWTKAFPECQRIVEKGNNQSMELDEDSMKGTWAKNDKSKQQFFIINEALILKLCILGENYEPCFEGSQITAPKIQFSFDNSFKAELFSMVNELKTLTLNKGGSKVFNTYSIEIGDKTWESIYSHVSEKYSGDAICGVYEDEDHSKFAVLQNPEDKKYYRLNFSMNEANEFSFDDNMIEMDENYEAPENSLFSEESVQEYAKRKEEEEKEKNQDKRDKNDCPKNEKETEDNSESEKDDEEEKKKKKKSEDDEFVCGKKKKYSLEEIPEYVQLTADYSALQSNLNSALEEINSLKEQINSLTAFKLQAELKDKQEMIDKFYMLNDEDKKEIVENINNYSLSEIESKLSVICFRNKVSFSDGEEKKESTTYSLNSCETDMPDWVKAVAMVSENLNK